eukprot:9189722-Pyramimonas_sp.AAC.1
MLTAVPAPLGQEMRWLKRLAIAAGASENVGPMCRETGFVDRLCPILCLRSRFGEFSKGDSGCAAA